MANHGYVVKCKKPFNMEKLGELGKKFCDEKLKGLVTFEKGEDLWFIHIPEDKYDGIQFWVGKYGKGKCVEIRHGHANSFWWWADFYLAAYLATELEGKINDDAFDKEIDPDVSKYESLDKYRRTNYTMDIGMKEYFDAYPILKALTKHPQPYKKTLDALKKTEEQCKAWGWK